MIKFQKIMEDMQTVELQSAKDPGWIYSKIRKFQKIKEDTLTFLLSVLILLNDLFGQIQNLPIKRPVRSQASPFFLLNHLFGT